MLGVPKLRHGTPAACVMRGCKPLERNMRNTHYETVARVQTSCRRRALVKGAMQHAWGNYVKYAFGHDELMPRSLRGKDPFGGLGATILDSLDTLWLMDMKAEYLQARDWVANDLNFTRYGDTLNQWDAPAHNSP